jgi:hypothetical protein
VDTQNGHKKTMKLPKSFKEKWIKALRSGEYKQTMGALYLFEFDAYCCLGVACRLHGKFDKIMDKQGVPEELSVKLPKYLTEHSVERQILIDMNDEGNTFKEIADYIEVNL